jgi:uncharacterized protein (TIGR02646 family)
MRFIAKQVARTAVQTGLASKQIPLTSEEASRRWSNFSSKSELLQELLVEQHFLCCYSELRADEVGLGYHIEHVHNKSQAPTETFEYANLAASALTNTDLAKPEIKAQSKDGIELTFGGHAKGKQAGVDWSRFISCHHLDCGRFFAYSSDGFVHTADTLNEEETANAIYTRDLLNLNSPYLVELRRQWWDELEQELEHSLQAQSDASVLAKTHLLPHVNPRNGMCSLSRFFSLTRRFYGARAEKLLSL